MICNIINIQNTFQKKFPLFWLLKETIIVSILTLNFQHIFLFYIIEILFKTMVYFFIPNIIGYFRFLLLIVTVFTFRDQPIVTIVCYSLSQILDAFDGMAARRYNQCTSFGSVLDMVCDRASNAVLLAICGFLYPDYSWFFFLDIILDLTSHWYQMYASLSCGEHHKNSTTNWKLLKLYYQKPILFTLVLGNELFLCTLYLNFYAVKLGIPEYGIMINNAGIVIGLVLFLIKKVMSVVGLLSACQKVAEKDMKQRQKLVSKSA